MCKKKNTAQLIKQANPFIHLKLGSERERLCIYQQRTFLHYNVITVCKIPSPCSKPPAFLALKRSFYKAVP